MVDIDELIEASRADDRTLVLFGCGCVRRVWDCVPVHGRHAVEVREQYERGMALQADYEAKIRLAMADRADARRPFQFGHVDDQSPEVAVAWAAGAALNAARGLFKVAADFSARVAGCISPLGYTEGFAAERIIQSQLFSALLAEKHKHA